MHKNKWYAPRTLVGHLPDNKRTLIRPLLKILFVPFDYMRHDLISCMRIIFRLMRNNDFQKPEIFAQDEESGMYIYLGDTVLQEVVKKFSSPLDRMKV